jgi:hypothetical protein
VDVVTELDICIDMLYHSKPKGINRISKPKGINRISKPKGINRISKPKGHKQD